METSLPTHCLLNASFTSITKAKLMLRVGLIATGGIGLTLAPISPSEAAVHFQILKSFPNWNLLYPQPTGPLIIGTDGALYGTARNGGTNALGSVYRMNKDGSGYTILHSFSSLEGAQPAAGLLEASDGVLNGTSTGGDQNTGAVFKLNKDGSGFTVQHHFGGGIGDGANPTCQLIEGSDGVLYGTTTGGGVNGGGTVFKLNKDGTGCGLLHSFGAGNDGQDPERGLIEGPTGALYGTTFGGGTAGGGTLFSLNKDGTGYVVLHNFEETTDGFHPLCALIVAGNAALYGTTSDGGYGTNPNGGTSGGVGTVFKFNLDGSGYQVLHIFFPNGNNNTFIGNEGLSPAAGLLKSTDGSLYGTTLSGGPASWNDGTVFRLKPDGTDYRVLGDIWGLAAEVVEDSDGALYSTTIGGVAFKLNKTNADLTVLHSFKIESPERWGPTGLIRGSDGTLYGTTSAETAESDDGGTVFKINQDGSGYAVLHTFVESGQRAPIEASDGVLYGISGSFVQDGSWVVDVYKLNKNGTGFSVIHRFSDADAYGLPRSGLVEGRDGALYGTACCLYTGTPGIDNAYAYKLNRDGSGFSVLHMFEDLTNGSTANWLTTVSDGALYGTTESGLGITLGRVFKLQPDGSNYQTLHDFGPTTNLNGWPGLGPLIEGSDGALYGTTAGSGFNDNSGATVFKLNKDGSGFETLLRPGPLPCTCFPPEEFPNLSPLVEARDGFIYGVMNYYSPDFGKVFRMKKDGSGYKELFSSFEEFVGQDFRPISGLVQGSDGAFYGTTSWGGLGGGGTVFKLWPPETPEISLTRASGSAGVKVSVTGVSGDGYQLLRSSDLKTWTLLSTFSMPPAGIYNYSDGSYTNSAAFYRAVWVP
jgi:uncharacterized repeat protein (TIGR03803 family)